MRKKHDIDTTESEFRLTQRGVKPLVYTKHCYRPPSPSFTSTACHLLDESDAISYPDHKEFNEIVGSNDLLEFHQTGLQHKVLRKLRTGQYNVQAVLDMHGMNAITAKQALDHFLLSCIKKEIRCVLIIHGKGYRTTGQPVLKNELNQWLRQMKHVLAFCSATSRDGGAGAVYALLRRGF